MGVLIHTDYGLWHAYRGALIFDHPLDGLPPQIVDESPCLSCREQPCLNTCPVAAFTPKGFDTSTCFKHLQSSPACMQQGCLARNACPVSGDHRYRPEQHRFHVRAFYAARCAEEKSDR